jgi:hypothetical protein
MIGSIVKRICLEKINELPFIKNNFFCFSVLVSWARINKKNNKKYKKMCTSLDETAAVKNILETQKIILYVIPHEDDDYDAP